MGTPHPILEVTGQDPESLQNNLTAAVNEACELAMLIGGHGILVTQHDFNSFTVSLSPDVPYGQTWEQRSFGRSGNWGRRGEAAGAVESVLGGACGVGGG